MNIRLDISNIQETLEKITFDITVINGDTFKEFSWITCKVGSCLVEILPRNGYQSYRFEDSWREKLEILIRYFQIKIKKDDKLIVWIINSELNLP